MNPGLKEFHTAADQKFRNKSIRVFEIFDHPKFLELSPKPAHSKSKALVFLKSNHKPFLPIVLIPLTSSLCPEHPVKSEIKKSEV